MTVKVGIFMEFRAEDIGLGAEGIGLRTEDSQAQGNRRDEG